MLPVVGRTVEGLCPSVALTFDPIGPADEPRDWCQIAGKLQGVSVRWD